MCVRIVTDVSSSPSTNQGAAIESSDQSEAKKLSQIHRQTDRQRINILSGPALRAAPAKKGLKIRYLVVEILSKNLVSFFWDTLYIFQPSE